GGRVLAGGWLRRRRADRSLRAQPRLDGGSVQRSIAGAAAVGPAVEASHGRAVGVDAREGDHRDQTRGTAESDPGEMDDGDIRAGGVEVVEDCVVTVGGVLYHAVVAACSGP